ncbi:MAG TPA: metal-dependent hydrolase [Terriglobales bacterium]|nr:metal-dependent hydrolase [Terriglobales bacterium]
MDPLTHMLFGSVMSRAGLNRKTGLATAVLAISAEFPDIDVVTSLAGPVAGFGNHRGITHTFIGAPFMAAASLGIVYGFYRWMKKRGRDTKLPPNWKLLYAYALLGSLSHILLDFTNNYGVRPLSPFLHRWYAWDIVYIIEPFLTGALLLALLMPWFFGLIGGEVGARKTKFPGQGSAIAALVFLALLWWARDYNHRRAIALLEAQKYEDQDPIRISAAPYMGNPFRWLGTVETESAFFTAPVDTLANEVDPQRIGIVRYKPEETAATLAAKTSALGKVYLDWARHPYAELIAPDRPGGDTTIRIRDLRYDYPELRERVAGEPGENDRTPLTMTVKLDPSMQVVEQRMGRHVEK